MVTIKATVDGDIPPNRLCTLSITDSDPTRAGITLQDTDPATSGIPEFNNVVQFTDGETVTIDTESKDGVWKVEAAGAIEAGALVCNDGTGMVAQLDPANPAMSTAGYATQQVAQGDITPVIPFAKISDDFLSDLGGGSSYTDQQAIAAINNDADHGSTASHTYFSGNFSDLSGVSVSTGQLSFDPATQSELNTHKGNASAHHSKTPEFTNSDAIAAINGSDITPNSVGIATVLNMPAASSAPASPTAGDIYVDDGTNSTSGSTAFRYYDGSAWVDL